MRLPEGISEAEFLKIAESISNKLSSNIVFGYNSREDIRQEVYGFCIEGLGSYDESRGKLKTYLYLYAKRQLLNLKRDTFERKYSQCKHCEDGTCKLCFEREMREENKKALFNGATDGSVQTTEDDIASKELFDRIDTQLPTNLRATYLKVLAKHPVSQTKKQELRDAIKEILYG
jgi:DNA-directed RNA polymerase specialized sigma24 family protein